MQYEVLISNRYQRPYKTQMHIHLNREIRSKNSKHKKALSCK